MNSAHKDSPIFIPIIYKVGGIFLIFFAIIIAFGIRLEPLQRRLHKLPLTTLSTAPMQRYISSFDALMREKQKVMRQVFEGVVSIESGLEGVRKLNLRETVITDNIRDLYPHLVLDRVFLGQFEEIIRKDQEITQSFLASDYPALKKDASRFVLSIDDIENEWMRVRDLMSQKVEEILFLKLEELQSLEKDMRQSLLIGALLLLLMMTLILILVTITLRRTFKKFDAFIAAMGRQEWSFPLLVRTHDEFEVMAREMRLMAGRLRTTLENLEETKLADETILESMGDGLIATDDAGNVLVMNGRAEKMLGRNLNESQGKLFIEVARIEEEKGQEIPPEKQPITLALMSGVATTPTPAVTYYFVRKDKVRFPVSLTVTPMVRKGLVLGAVIVFHDISAEKELEDARLNFISLASHQFRTPLTGLRWFIELLLEGDVGPLKKEQKSLVERVYEGILRMTSTVNLLLQIARAEAGRVKVEPIPTDFQQLTERVILNMRQQLEAEKQEIRVVAPPEGLPPVPIDSDIMREVMVNLLDNAIRYSPPNSPVTVTITFDAQKSEYRWAVEDHGIGIPSHQQGRIFEKFFRADNAFKYVPIGSGLGLSLVKRLVEDWQGKVWFESREGIGSTFYFTVPSSGMKSHEGMVKLSV